MSRQRITSRQNPYLQHVKKLQTSASYRRTHQEFVGDGVKLLEEAARWYEGLHTVLVTEGVQLCQLADHVRVIEIPQSVMESISQMKTPQGALFVCSMPKTNAFSLSGNCLVLEGIQDPGNLGTILRTADALEVPVVLAEGCADLYQPKVVRATMGAIFRTQPQMASGQQIAEACQENDLQLTATALTESAEDIRACSLERAAVIIGSEGRGISQELLELAKKQVIIPMRPACESLNAAVAATIVMWQMKCT